MVLRIKLWWAYIRSYGCWHSWKFDSTFPSTVSGITKTVATYKCSKCQRCREVLLG